MADQFTEDDHRILEHQQNNTVSDNGETVYLFEQEEEVDVVDPQDASMPPQPSRMYQQTMDAHINTESTNLPFMTRQWSHRWETIDIDEPYVPQIGSMVNGRMFDIEPPGTILALGTPCARGKSKATQKYIIDSLLTQKATRALCLSANILFGTNFTAEMTQACSDHASIKVGFYRDDPKNLDQYNIVVCSIESIHHLEGQKFDIVMIDEIGTVARLIGGATMINFHNAYTLREMCDNAPYIVVCDADMKLKLGESQPCSVAESFMTFLFRKRPVLYANFTHPGPDHLKRGVEVSFDYKDGSGRNTGRMHLFNELTQAARRWHVDHTKRFGFMVGAKSQLQEVYDFLVNTCRVPTKPYSGDTDEKSKLIDLRDTATAWKDYGCILATTSLSIGVDPKGIEFDSVFMWTHRLGCPVLAEFQGVMRFGRQIGHPLGKTVVHMLVGCVNPNVERTVAQQNRKTRSTPSTYEDTFKHIVKRRGAAARHLQREFASINGYRLGIAGGGQSPVSDEMLRIMAHTELERYLQMVDHWGVVERCIRHYKWEMKSPRFADRLEFRDKLEVRVNEEDHFAAGLPETEKWVVTVTDIIANRGEGGFFDERCYGLDIDKDDRKRSDKPKTAREIFLLKAYWLLKPVSRMPIAPSEITNIEDRFVIQAAQLMQMNKPDVHDGLCLNAHSRCMDVDTILRADATRRLESGGRPVAHPMLKPTVAMRLRVCGTTIAGLLQISSPFVDCEIPTQIVDAANRFQFKTQTTADIEFKNSLAAAITEIGMCAKGSVTDLIKLAATACGMTLEGTDKKDKSYIRHPSATAKCGKVWMVTFLRLRRMLPDIVDDWQLYSPRLRYGVCTLEWHRMHRAMDEEEALESFDNDDDDMVDLPQMTIIGESRVEKLDGAAIDREIGRIRSRADPTAQDVRWLQWLEKADAEATPVNDRGVRELTVSYAKSATRAIGRRTASTPSMQLCPSGLRPRIVGRYYHDIDMQNCHPTLMYQVATFMGVSGEDLAVLDKYITYRKKMLESIAVHYGTSPTKAKYAVLRVLNGGDVRTWALDKNMGCTIIPSEAHEDMDSMALVAENVRESFFNMHQFRETVARLKSEMETTTKARLNQARGRLATAKTEGTPPERLNVLSRAVGKAASKASRESIARSALSACMFELEDMILNEIDLHFQEKGWTVSSLQFDGLHVEHKADDTFDEESESWTLLTETMRSAQEAVMNKLKYKITLTEKALYTPDTGGVAQETEVQLFTEEELQELAQDDGDDA